MMFVPLKEMMESTDITDTFDEIVERILCKQLYINDICSAKGSNRIMLSTD